MKKKILVFVFLLISLFPLCINERNIVYATDLDEEINDQLEEIDFSEIENILSSIDKLPDNYNFMGKIKGILSGDYNLSYDDFANYLLSILLGDIKQVLPSIISVIILSFLVSILNTNNLKLVGENVSEIVNLIGNIAVLLIFSFNIITAYRITIDFIDSIFNINQALSPIILTLMVASGGSISATVYKPVVVMLSGGVVNVVKNVLMPIILAISTLNIISVLIPRVKFNAFIDFLSSLVKWILGFTIAIFGIFLSVQGIASSVHDGISLKAAKYAISNSVPLIGGFLSNGFDLVICGSVLIKNAIGISSIFLIFYMLLSPLSYLLSLNFLLKLSSGVTEMLGDGQTSKLCTGISKGVTYFIICNLMVFFMLFILILLMIFSANAFI